MSQRNHDDDIDHYDEQFTSEDAKADYKYLKDQFADQIVDFKDPEIREILDTVGVPYDQRDKYCTSVQKRLSDELNVRYDKCIDIIVKHCQARDASHGPAATDASACPFPASNDQFKNPASHGPPDTLTQRMPSRQEQVAELERQCLATYNELVRRLNNASGLCEEEGEQS